MPAFTLSIEGQKPVTGNMELPGNEIRRMRAFNQRIQGDTNQCNVFLTPGWNNDAGADWPIALGPKEKALIARVNPGENWNGRFISTEEKLQWACKVDTIGYLYMSHLTRDSDWQWWYIVMASRIGYPEQVNVVKVKSYYGTWVDIETIPVMENYDVLSPQTHPWLFPQVYAGSFLTPKGHFIMPLFSPIGRRHHLPADSEIKGCFIPTEYLI